MFIVKKALILKADTMVYYEMLTFANSLLNVFDNFVSYEGYN